jgi:GNAT superfamily N-acetyltransferase
MWWRLPRAEFTRGKGEGNRAAFASLVDAGTEPGILAYLDDVPVGWCAVAPRSDYGGLARSRVLKPVDDTPVWSITCLFVTKPCRRSGLSVLLLDAAARFAAARGARVVEGYPVDPASGTTADAFAWTGLRSAFERAGFAECARRSPGRPIMRRHMTGNEGRAARRPSPPTRQSRRR